MRHFKGYGSDSDGEESQDVQVYFDNGRSEEDRELDFIQAGIDAHEVNQNTLALVIDVLEKSFWWRFRSTKSKLRLIKETYDDLSELI